MRKVDNSPLKMCEIVRRRRPNISVERAVSWLLDRARMLIYKSLNMISNDGVLNRKTNKNKNRMGLYFAINKSNAIAYISRIKWMSDFSAGCVCARRACLVFAHFNSLPRVFIYFENGYLFFLEICLILRFVSFVFVFVDVNYYDCTHMYKCVILLHIAQGEWTMCFFMYNWCCFHLAIYCHTNQRRQSLFRSSVYVSRNKCCALDFTNQI